MTDMRDLPPRACDMIKFFYLPTTAAFLTYTIHQFQTNRSRIRRGIVFERIFLADSPTGCLSEIKRQKLRVPTGCRDENERGYILRLILIKVYE